MSDETNIARYRYARARDQIASIFVVFNTWRVRTARVDTLLNLNEPRARFGRRNERKVRARLPRDSARRMSPEVPETVKEPPPLAIETLQGYEGADISLLLPLSLSFSMARRSPRFPSRSAKIASETGAKERKVAAKSPSRPT